NGGAVHAGEGVNTRPVQIAPAPALPAAALTSAPEPSGNAGARAASAAPGTDGTRARFRGNPPPAGPSICQSASGAGVSLGKGATSIGKGAGNAGQSVGRWFSRVPWNGKKKGSS